MFSEGTGRVRDVFGVSLGIFPREDDSVHGAPEGADSGQKRAVGPGKRGFEEERVQVSGIGDCVCASAGLRHGE